MIMLRRFIVLALIVLGVGTAFARDPDRPAHAEAAAQTRPGAGSGIRPGLWEGSVELRPKASAAAPQDASGKVASPAPGGADARIQKVSSPLSLRLLEPASGGLLDMPEQSMFGFPLSNLSWRQDRISFRLETGSDVSAIAFNGFLAKTAQGAAPKIVGSLRGEELSGSFAISLVPDRLLPGETRLSVDTGMGLIPGSLIIPESAGSPMPLVLMISASGTTDRDGNNFNVPGKNDAFRLLASALAQEGIASYRYDKRGAGEAYKLVYDESFLRFYQYVNDAAEVIARFRGDERFSRIVLLCHAEGALVGAAALNRLGLSGTFVDAMMMLCASDKSPSRGVEDSLADTPAELEKEAKAIMQALKAGKEYPSPSPYFSDFFRPSFQAYLSSWFQYDPFVEIPSVMVPLAFVHGGRDLQVSQEELDGLLALRPSASAYILPGMNHALKEVPEDRDRNFDAFTDPSFPLGKGLVELVAAFAKVKPIPPSIQRYRR